MKPKNSGNFMTNEERLAVLETTMSSINNTLIDIKHDVRRSAERMDAKFEALENKIDSKLDALDKKFDTKLDALDKKFDTKLDALDRKFDTKFDRLENRMWAHFFWLMSLIIGLAGLIAHAQHWL